MKTVDLKNKFPIMLLIKRGKKRFKKEKKKKNPKPANPLPFPRSDVVLCWNR